MSEQQITRIEAVQVDGGWRLSMNGRLLGPVIEDGAHVSPILVWFVDYQAQLVADTLRRMGITARPVREMHAIDFTTCPRCGREIVPGEPQTVIEDPCSVCRR